MSQSKTAVKKAPETHLVTSRKPVAAAPPAVAPRARATPPPNPYLADCPTRMILDRIGDKWAVLDLGLLQRAPVRFNQLRRRIEGVSQKMLSQTLKSLERDGLVHRRAIATVPVTVEYSITPLGLTLASAVHPWRDWAEHSLKEVLAAQRRNAAQRKPLAA